MAGVKQDPYLVTSELIANAINTARVFGENRRISSLIAGSIKRFMAEMDDGPSLLGHAMACIDEEDAGYVPVLVASLKALPSESV